MPLNTAPRGEELRRQRKAVRNSFHDSYFFWNQHNEKYYCADERAAESRCFLTRDRCYLKCLRSGSFFLRKRGKVIVWKGIIWVIPFAGWRLRALRTDVKDRPLTCQEVTLTISVNIMFGALSKWCKMTEQVQLLIRGFMIKLHVCFIVQFKIGILGCIYLLDYISIITIMCRAISSIYEQFCQTNSVAVEPVVQGMI